MQGLRQQKSKDIGSTVGAQINGKRRVKVVGATKLVRLDGILLRDQVAVRLGSHNQNWTLSEGGGEAGKDGRNVGKRIGI